MLNLSPIDIPDIENPDRDRCLVSSCQNLQRNHGNKIWGKYCDKHHRDSIFASIRKAEREGLVESRKRRLDAKKADKVASWLLPRECSFCGETRDASEFSKKGHICKSCKALKYRNHRIKRVYGITEREYKALYASQGGVCAICGLPAKDKQPLYIDHCHDTGKVRGLLCSSCNSGIGYFKDDLDLIASASSYLINSRLDKLQLA